MKSSASTANNYLVYFSRKAEKEFARLSLVKRRLLMSRLEMLSWPLPDNLDIKFLKGAEGKFYRLRVGQLRVIFEVNKDKKEIWIRKVGYRGGVYKH